MTTYAGSITTTGSSDAIRLEKAMFRQHPEFSQKAKVTAHVIGKGTLLVHVQTDDAQIDGADDPMVMAYLAFLENDAQTNPQHIEPVPEALLQKARALTKDVRVSDDDVLPDDVTL